MGHHYVPQEYLRGFADPDNSTKIWMYDKRSRQFNHPFIKSVGQEVRYYNETTERELSKIVEGPAHRVLQKLRREHKINNTERARLALYIGTMLMRVPSRRRRAFEMLPRVLEDTINRITNQVAQWAGSATAKPELVSRRFAELEGAREKFRNEPPAEIIEHIRAPWPSEQVLALVSAMNWRIVSSGESLFFLTSDNPVYFFEAYGLGSAESELTFPLASELALLASWQGIPHATIFMKAKPALVKEVNRRVASGAERFLFCRAQKGWVDEIADKQNPYLNRIQW